MAEGFAQTIQGVKVGRGFNSYLHSKQAADYFGTEVFLFMWGGKNPEPHVLTRGVYSPDVAEFVRATWPVHRCTRADSAMDLAEPGLFDDLAVRFQAFAKSHSLAFEHRGDWRPEGERDPLSGRTFYVGAQSSLARLRVYEKGKQCLKEWRASDEPPDLNWVRAELEVKPQDRDGKTKLSRLTPDAAWGVSIWTRQALRELTGVAAEKVIMWQPKETNAFRAVRHMLAQYRESMQTVIEAEGGDEAFMRFARSIWNGASAPAGADTSARTHAEVRTH